MIRNSEKGMVFVRMLFFVTSLLLLSAAVAFAAEPVGKIERAQAKVWTVRDGKRVDLSQGAALFEFDVLCTDNSGSATVRFKDDTVLELRHGSHVDIKEVAFSEARSRFNVGVVSGTAKIITGMIVNKNPKGFKITTPKSTIGIRGTEFTVVVDSVTGRESVTVDNISAAHTVEVNYTAIGESRSLQAAGASASINEQNAVESSGSVVDTTGLDGSGASRPTGGVRDNTQYNTDYASDSRGGDGGSSNSSGGGGSSSGSSSSGSSSAGADSCENDNSSPPR